MENKNSYLDIYKNNGKIIFQLGKDIFLDKDSKQFFNYLGYLKKQKINVILLDENGNQVFNSDGNNYFLDKEKKEVGYSINNILILDNSLEILDKKNNKIEFISLEKLKEILNENHKKIKIEKNSKLYKKLEEILKLLENGVSKVTLVGIDGVKQEIEGLGVGTMFVDLEKAKFKKLENKEIFKQIYIEKNLSGEWKYRKQEEIEKIATNYDVLEIDGTILGGYYLGNFEIEIDGNKKNGKLLENLFATKTGGGIGQVLAEKIKQEKGLIFAYSKQEKYFEALGFKKIDGKKSNSGACLWMYEK